MYLVTRKGKNIHIHIDSEVDKGLINKELSLIASFSKSIQDISKSISLELNDLIQKNSKKRIKNNKVVIEIEYFNFIRNIVEDIVSDKISEITKTEINEKEKKRFTILLKIINRFV